MTMTGTDGTLILLGVFIIISRGPLAIWPAATREVYHRLLKTNLRVRLFGLALLPLPVVMILVNQGGPEDAAIILTGLGYLFICIVLVFLLLIPGIYRLIADAVLEGMDTVILRGVGVIGIVIGILLIYTGLR
jgi:hypothetical protein